jgi:transposase
MKHTDIATRALICGLKAAGQTTAEVSFRTGVPSRTVDAIYGRAITRGFDPARQPLEIKDSYLADAARTGRPSKAADPATIEAVVSKVRRDRYGREKTCADLAGDLSLEGLNLSATTVWRVLKAAGFKKTKPTRKPGLTKTMKKARLDWCLAHQDWTLEDWKRVIWSDETAVVLLHRRGSYRIWRQPSERFLRSCIRER